MSYKLISHTADMGIRVTNKTLNGLFEDAAFALFDILTDIKTIKPLFIRPISVQAIDNEELLNEFLNKLLSEFTVNNNLIGKVKMETIVVGAYCNTPVRVGHLPLRLSAVIYGEPFNPKRHLIKIEIKAITFNDIYVKKTRSGYEGQVIFDV